MVTFHLVLQHDLPDVLYTKTNNFYTIVGLTIACVTITGLVVSLAVLVLIKKRRKTMTLKENLVRNKTFQSQLFAFKWCVMF